MKSFAVVALCLVLVLASVGAALGKGPCYTVLEDLADEKESERTLDGLLTMGFGGLLIALGIAMSADYYYTATGILVGAVGVVYVGVGVGTLLIPTRAEREFARVQEEAVADQERRCDVVLDKLATRARNARYLSAILNGVTGFAYIAMGEAMLGLADLGRAVYKAVFESDEERAQRKYDHVQDSRD